jgi:hypothetical protein
MKEASTGLIRIAERPVGKHFIWGKHTEMPESFTKDNNAIAYGIGVLLAFLFLSSLFYIAYTLFVSGLLDVFNNTMIPTDNVSVDRGGSMLYLRRMWAAIPFFVLIAGALWGVVRALEQKQTEGT